MWKILRPRKLYVQHMFIIFRSSRPEVFLGKGVLKISSKFNRRSSMPKCDFNCNFIEIAPRHVCSPVNLLHIFRTPFPKKNPYGCFCNSLMALVEISNAVFTEFIENVSNFSLLKSFWECILSSKSHSFIYFSIITYYY